MSQPGSADGIFTRWLAVLLSCFGQAQRSGSVAVTSGVEREMNVPHNQPHLVPPMKLVFYDEMPKSPGPRPCSANRMSHWVSQGKELASKASFRASLIIKKKLSKPNISGPLPVTTADGISPRRQQFRPLELSIYLPGNRLSDLPEFEDVAFTGQGEIQVPPKALIRTQSENMLPPFSQPQTSRPTISMVGERQLDYWQQQQRSSSLVSQQPPSVFEPLNSHPVCWSSLSGLPPQSEAVTGLLSPMTEEEEEEPSSVPLQTADNTMLDFPPLYAQEQAQPQAQNRSTATTLPPPSIRIPYKKPFHQTPTHETSSSSNRPRISISHWLSFSSTTTTKATKPSQFYQCAITPPLPQREHQHQHQHQHSHTPPHNRHTPSFTSSSSPSSSSIGWPLDSDTESIASMTSSTTAPTTVLDFSRSWSRSRSATLRTVDSGMGSNSLRVGVGVLGVGEEEGVPVPDVPDMVLYAKIGLGEVREAGKAPAAI